MRKLRGQRQAYVTRLNTREKENMVRVRIFALIKKLTPHKSQDEMVSLMNSLYSESEETFARALRVFAKR